jgi:DhnA family fructose-bisphosphate aldolase class Ia
MQEEKMSSLGKQIRLSRIINQQSGKAFFVTMDHAITRGVMPGIDNIKETMGKMVAGGPDALTMHKGIAKEYFPPYVGKAALVIKASSFAPYHPTYDTVVTDVEEAIYLGADAISLGVLVGGDRQAEMLRELGKFSKEAAFAGLPLIAHIYPAGESIKNEERYDWKHMAYAARAGVELGVDIIKTWYTGDQESFRKVVDATHGRVVAAGGPKMDTPQQLFAVTKDVMDAGAIGVAYGRNIFQYKDPTRMIEALKALIHGKSSVEDALKLLGES